PCAKASAASRRFFAPRVITFCTSSSESSRFSLPATSSLVIAASVSRSVEERSSSRPLIAALRSSCSFDLSVVMTRFSQVRKQGRSLISPRRRSRPPTEPAPPAQFPIRSPGEPAPVLRYEAPELAAPPGPTPGVTDLGRLTRWRHARAIRNPPGNHGGRCRRAAVRGGLRGPLVPPAAGDGPRPAPRDAPAARTAGLRHPPGQRPAQEAAVAALPGGPAPRLRDQHGRQPLRHRSRPRGPGLPRPPDGVPGRLRLRLQRLLRPQAAQPRPL